MSKFKWIAILCIFLLLLAPIAFFFLPSWNTKLSPMLTLMNNLDALGKQNKMALGGFSFVGSDNDSMTLRIDLTINNTIGQDMLFPALNLTLSYGNEPLGTGWVNPAQPIKADKVSTVSIYAKMYKGDIFDKFLASLIAGHLSLSIGAGQAFVFMETFGGIQDVGVMTIPLPSIALPAVNLAGANFWPPTIHKIIRGTVVADTPVDIIANVSDQGSGVREVILSWNDNSGWVNATMTGLPLKQLFGDTIMGIEVRKVFTSYPPSPILTACPGVFGIVSGQIPGHSSGTHIQYRLYIIDDAGYVTIVPSTLPTYNLSATAVDTINLDTQTFNYTVPFTSLSDFTAVWLPSAQAAAGGLTGMMNSLLANGIDIMGAIMGGSPVLPNIFKAINDAISQSNLTIIYNALTPIIVFFEERGINPFEVMDQLMGFSGGLIPEMDKNIHINTNGSVALDYLTEKGMSLTDLLTELEVNFTKVVEALSDAVLPPIVDINTGVAFSNVSAGVTSLLKKTFQDPVANESFFKLLETRDLFYIDYPLYRLNNTGSSWMLLPENFSIVGDPGTKFYFGSLPLPNIVNTIKGDKYSILDVKCATPADPAIKTKYQWEIQNPIDINIWDPLPVKNDETDNFNKSGKIFFDIDSIYPTEHAPPLSTQNNIQARWIRLNITAPINTNICPTLSGIYYTKDRVLDYLGNVSLDGLRRPYNKIIVNETDSILNLMRSLDKTPSNGMLIWNILSYKGNRYDVPSTPPLNQGINFSTFVQAIGGRVMSPEDWNPVLGIQIVNTTAITLGIMVYGILAIAVIAIIRGRKGAYSISPLRVKKWYDNALVTPSLKGREAIEKYKIK